MFLRVTNRFKDGKDHRYWSIVENRRLNDGRVAQRTVLYLGEINDAQRDSWQKSIEVFDQEAEEMRQLSLFPEDRLVGDDDLDVVQVKLSQMELRRPRSFGDCWLVCHLWKELGLDRFWSERLPLGREAVGWSKVLQLLVVNRVIAPGSEWRLHRQWFDRSAMDELLGYDFVLAEKNRIYRCLDRLLRHKRELFSYLQQRWEDLFCAKFDVLLYDLTSTYFEGQMEQYEKARHGYSRDGRGDCRQVVIGLILTPEGFPIAYEVMPGNTQDRTTLRRFLRKIEAQYGKANRIWVMDRGVPTEEVLAEMRASTIPVYYLVGTPRGRLTKLEKAFIELPWAKVRDWVQVKLLPKDGEVYVLSKSEGRRQKERAIRRRKLKNLWQTLHKLQAQKITRDELLLGLGAAKKEAGQAYGLVKIHLPKEGEAVNAKTFHFQLHKDKLRKVRHREGHYLLRSNITGKDAAELWQYYMQLTEIEAAFRSLKDDLAIRPIYHQLPHRIESHIFVTFLAYCLLVTLKKTLAAHAPGLTPRAVLEKLAGIEMLDVYLPTTDGRCLIMPRYTKPETEQELLLEKLRMKLPSQPAPYICAATSGRLRSSSVVKT